MGIIQRYDDFLMHYGVKGMKWGVVKLDEEAQKIKKRNNNVGSTVSYAKKDSTGQYGYGNIDLNNRKVVKNDDGSISTERSFSVNIDGKEVLLPTVVDGKIISEDEAIDHYFKTGEYLGKFDTVEDAERYAEALHNRQDWYYNEVKSEEDESEDEETNNTSKKKKTKKQEILDLFKK